MEASPIPQDDLLDVMEMTRKMEGYFHEILEENELNLAMSALMSTAINCMLGQCNNMEDVRFYRNLFMKMFDNSIKSIRVQGPEKN